MGIHTKGHLKACGACGMLLCGVQSEVAPRPRSGA